MSTPSTGQPPGAVSLTRMSPKLARMTARPPVQRIGSPLAPDVSEPGLAVLRLPELRTLRRDSQRDEADLSYVRRLLQGRIDILRAELARRGGVRAPAAGEPPVPAAAEGPSVVERLPEILRDAPARYRSSARHVTVGTP